MVTRRRLMQLLAAALPAAYLPRGWSVATGGRSVQRAPHVIAPGPFQATWDSLKQYAAPDWFRDAKFGIWAHWTAQCVPEQGDWYARTDVPPGRPRLRLPREDVRPPVAVRLHGDRQPLEGRAVGSGGADGSLCQGRRQVFRRAREPSRQLRRLRLHAPSPGTPSASARRKTSSEPGRSSRAQRGLRFGVTNHSAHAWHWFQTAYGYDPGGPRAGARYDAFRLKKEDGDGQVVGRASIRSSSTPGRTS